MASASEKDIGPICMKSTAPTEHRDPGWEIRQSCKHELSRPQYPRQSVIWADGKRKDTLSVLQGNGETKVLSS